MADQGDKVQLDEDTVCFLQEILHAISNLPGAWDRVEAYLMGVGYDRPRDEMDKLRGLIF